MSEKIGLILRVYNMKIAEATKPSLMKFDPESGFPLKYLEITVNQLTVADTLTIRTDSRKITETL